jgi:excisionase family DNA binding protein
MAEQRSLVDIEQAAAIPGVTVPTLYKWARARRVPCIRFGARIRFDPRALDRFVAQNTVEAK